MLKATEQKLEEANKLIFVKRYGEAEALLDSLLASPDAHGELLVHLRRIELAVMLRTLDKLRSGYLKALQAGQDVANAELCLALVQQQEESFPAKDAASTFTDLIKRHGTSAAAYYGIAYSMEQQGNFERAIFNYQQALQADPTWVIAYFGLSQVHYQIGDEKRGDHFFYLFERASPYNVYGNFETHRTLCQEFLERERFADAEAAIQSLSIWWTENKGSCPLEIQIYELFAMARISEAQGDKAQAAERETRAHALAQGALAEPKTGESVLYFIAKVIEDFEGLMPASRFYRRILASPTASGQLVQKIGSQLLAQGEFRLSRELFREAIQAHPEHPDVRFCLLVAELKLASVNVEEYLIGRERLRQLMNGGDKVELLALLHSLLAKFDGDGEVHGHIADVYQRLGNIERAGRHFDRMYQLDRFSRATILKYAAFVLHNRDVNLAMSVLATIPDTAELTAEEQGEVYWLKASFHARQEDFATSLTLLRKVQAFDPWNVSYLVQEIINLMALVNLEPELKAVDKILTHLAANDEAKIEWQEFDQRTGAMESAHAYELVYARRKLRYLYASGSDSSLTDLVLSACHHDAARATYDFMKLLNTNFDSFTIYWALGTLFKELWQLETASVWFEQMLLYPNLPAASRAKAYLELSDCFAWAGKHLGKAVEYAKLALDLDENREVHTICVLAHALLKAGQIRQASLALEAVENSQDSSVLYLKGLIQYRNGATQQANLIWKPLLTMVSESLRFHTLKQDVLRYYFDGAPYLKAN